MLDKIKSNFNIYRVLVLFCICLLVPSPITTHALVGPHVSANQKELEYWYELRFDPPSQLAGFYEGDVWQLESDNPLVFYVKDNSYGTICALATDEGTVSNVYMRGWMNDEGTMVDYAVRHEEIGVEWEKYHTWNYSHEDSPVYECLSITTENVMLFDSLENATAYIDSGSMDGCLIKPGVDYTIEHDFVTDTYDPSVPVPIIGNISHEGFKLTNMTDGLNVDIIMESTFNGVEIKGQGFAGVIQPRLAVREEWIINNHYYNFLLSELAIDYPDININDIYGIDNIALLTDDFKSWSGSYPEYSDLPTYSWTYISVQLQNTYNQLHDYYQSAYTSDLEKLNGSGQALTTFYIRYYTDDIKYGQWVKYSYRSPYIDMESDKITGGGITSGIVDITPSGDVVIKDEISGTVDSSGNISYTPNYSTSTGTDGALNSMLTGLDEFMKIMEIFKQFTGELPEYVDYLFGFFPWWLNAMLIAIIVVSIVLRVLGR